MPEQDVIARTPEPPYYAVIFMVVRTTDDEGYDPMADRMVELAGQQSGFLGVEFVNKRWGGITISYWDSEDAIRRWKQNVDHLEAQSLGRSKWYSRYKVRVAKVERDYGFGLDD